MITSAAEAKARLVRVAALASVLGALHTLSLLLTWYTISYQNLETQTINGYLLNESMLLSLLAGVLAGASSIFASIYPNFIVIRRGVPIMAIAAGGLAISSPLYSYFYKMPIFEVSFVPQIGFISSVFSGGGMLAVGMLAMLIVARTRTEYAYSQESLYQSMTPELYEEGWTEATAATAREEVIQPQKEVVKYRRPSTKFDTAQCMICYEQASSASAVECPSCGAIFHKDCIDSWIDLGGNCPECGSRIEKG